MQIINDLTTLQFGQHKPLTQYLGYPCFLNEFPHFDFLKGDIGKYTNYLKKSWGTAATNTTIDRQILKFNLLVKDIKEKGITNPIRYVRSPSGNKVIIDGNHRASIAATYKYALPGEITSIEAHIKNLVTLGKHHRYGTKVRGLPYHSIFYNGIEYIKGRRQDTLDRQRKIGDLTGKTIIDFGSNYGSSSILACEFGARHVTGIEYASGVILAACRLNSLFSLPISYMKCDLSKPVNLEMADIGFVFSVDAHIGNNTQLAETIKKSIRDIVYFECHTNRSIPQEVKSLFSNIISLGKNFDDRAFYKCILNK